MASTNDPTALSDSTRLRPRSFLPHSRSPSGSPVRRTQFAAQELDPLLSNLSPESTLRALQATETISGGQRVPDALSRSIADASELERELGIRAALAAQKIRAWLQELAAWSWPVGRASALGVGFLTHETTQAPPSDADPFLGSLRTSQVRRYEKRIAEIQDALGALEIEDIKDYVLDAHVPSRAITQMRAEARAAQRQSYGRMRDFTALITATIIRVLPDLAKLNMLLVLWNVRLAILQTIPEFLHKLNIARNDVRNAMTNVRDEELGADLRQPELEMTRSTLAEQVSTLGGQVDRMLDLLEGQDDRLPQGWIDDLENLEIDFASWVVEAQRRVLHNEWMAQAIHKSQEPLHDQQEQESMLDDTKVVFDRRRNSNHAPISRKLVQAVGQLDDHGSQHLPANSIPTLAAPFGEASESEPVEDNIATKLSSINPNVPDTKYGTDEDPDLTPLAPIAHQPFSFLTIDPALSRQLSQRKPLTLELPKAGHKREVSEVSIADSAYSAFSDMSNAEIFDATTAEYVASQKVSMVDNPFRASRDNPSSFVGSTHSDTQGGHINPSLSGQDSQIPVEQYASRPPILHRASTASTELVGTSQIKRGTVNHSPSSSQDLSLLLANSNETAPSNGSEHLTGEDVISKSSSNEMHSGLMPVDLDSSHPVVQGDNRPPLSFRSIISEPHRLESPSLPRRSSKRTIQGDSSPVSATRVFSPRSAAQFTPETDPRSRSSAGEEKTSKATADTLQSKIQNILTSLPRAIRLADNPESSESPSQTSTTSSTRSSTPVPSLVLSPAKDKLNRQNTENDRDVRVYHLTRPGQPRDTPPTKLFVRLVGEGGERVMVRVGGGWADLGEYLREYSLHHGRRGTVDGRLEVATFPAKGQSPKDVIAGTPPIGSGNLSKAPTGMNVFRAKSRSPSTSDTVFDFASLPDIDTMKGRQGPPSQDRARSPPVPAIPNSYTMHSPTMVSSLSAAQGSPRTYTTEYQPEAPTSSTHSRVTTGDPYNLPSRLTTTMGPGAFITTTTSNPKYTPLGAAGPKTLNKSNGRRATTLGAVSTPENDAWVDDMVGKARAVSGSNLGPVTTVTHGPTTVTTTTSSGWTVSTPNSRRVSVAVGESPASGGRATPTLGATPTSTRVSTIMAESPGNGRGTPSPSPSGDKSSPVLGTRERSKSRMSLGDVSGIKRVFLKRKTEK